MQSAAQRLQVDRLSDPTVNRVHAWQYQFYAQPSKAGGGILLAFLDFAQICKLATDCVSIIITPVARRRLGKGHQNTASEYDVLIPSSEQR